MEKSIYGPFKGDCVEKSGKFPGYKRKLSGVELFNLSKSSEQVPVTNGWALAVHTPSSLAERADLPEQFFLLTAELSRVLRSLTSDRNQCLGGSCWREREGMLSGGLPDSPSHLLTLSFLLQRTSEQ